MGTSTGRGRAERASGLTPPSAEDPTDEQDLHADDATQTDSNQFDPFSSDLRTYLAHRPYPDKPDLRPPGSKSSDPPTSFVRRPTAHIELPPGSMIDEIYEIDHRLGAGAMGEVYAARHVKLNKRVAIKVISPRLSEDAAAVERFVQEAQTLAAMRHPGLVDVLGFGTLADGRAYFVMEYLSGRTLYERLEAGRLDHDEALDVFGQIARALDAAHMHGVVHRDLKPENIFLVNVTNEPRPIVRLLDFGLARLEVEVDRRAERTQSGVVIGTAMYLSPEQARGPDVDGRTDIYALGCVGYELLLGEHPFRGAHTVAALIAAHMHEVPPMPRAIDPGIPAELDLMLFAMIAKDPQHRPTLPQIRSVIERVRSTASPQARSEVIEPRAPTVSTPHPAVDRRTLAIVGIVLVVGIIIGAAARGSRSNAPAASGQAASVVPNPVDGGSAYVPTPMSAIDAAVGDVAVLPSPPMDASSAHRHFPPVAGALVEAKAPMATPPPDATTEEMESVSAPMIDAGIEPMIEIDATVKPATALARPPVPPKPKERALDDRSKSSTDKNEPKSPTDRNQVINPFKKPATR
jgi:tRNA A-37 threonylcarbamoyl transferase component Bud32